MISRARYPAVILSQVGLSALSYSTQLGAIYSSGPTLSIEALHLSLDFGSDLARDLNLVLLHHESLSWVIYESLAGRTGPWGLPRGPEQPSAIAMREVISASEMSERNPTTRHANALFEL